MKFKLNILLFSFIATITAKQVDLKNIVIIEDKSEYRLALQFNATPEYVASTSLEPPYISLQILGGNWEKGDYSQTVSAGELYRYNLEIQRNTLSAKKLHLTLFFQKLPDYRIYLDSDSAIVVAWPKIIKKSTAFIPARIDDDFLKPVTVNFKSANLSDVVRILIAETGLNLVMGDLLANEVNESVAKVTLTLNDVPLQTALKSILNVNGYEYFVMDNIVVIKPIESMLEGELSNRIYNLKYITGDIVAKALEGVLTDKGSTIPFSSGSGKSSVNDRIMVVDRGQNFNQITGTIEQLDQKTPQINISVKFIETTLKEDETIGINWTLRANLEAPGGVYGEIDTTESDVLNFGKLFLGGQTLNFATLTPPAVKSLLEMLATDSDTKLLQEPQVTTFNNHEANIKVGTSVPILVPQLQSSVIGVVPYTYENQNIDISLDVLPRINDNSFVSMNVNAVVQAIVGYVGAEQRPIVSSRSAATNVMVMDGGTLLIGGLIFSSNGVTLNKMPLLGDLPLIKHLFRRKVTVDEKRELLIFITASIIP